MLGSGFRRVMPCIRFGWSGQRSDRKARVKNGFMSCSSGRIEGQEVRRLPVPSLVGSNGCLSDYSIGLWVRLQPMDVFPIILSVYRPIGGWENYSSTTRVGVPSVLLFGRYIV